MPVKHLEGGAFFCAITLINLSVKLSKLEFARTSLAGINTYFHSFLLFAFAQLLAPSQNFA